jgi:DNA processing protein
MKLTDTTLGILALWLIPGLGPRRIQRLLDAFSSVSSIFNSPPRNLAELIDGDRQIAQSIPAAMDSKELEKELMLIERHGIELLDFTHADYPPLLKEIYNAPPILYKKGNVELSEGLFLAFVGSRKASFAGKNICKRLIQNLARVQPDLTIVSGLALGIDTAAHEAAIEAGLKTIGVLANGLSDVYPVRNRKLASKVIQKGALITEFPMTAKPLAKNFPLRNRIISGISQGVIIVEAGIRSGASITAGYALEQNRELFALPGPADSSYYKGTNRLIQKGQAKLIMEADDILEEFSLINEQLSYQDVDTESETEIDNLTESEIVVLNLIKQGCNQKDQIIARSQLPVQELLPILINLEMKGFIISKPGAFFEIVNDF